MNIFLTVFSTEKFLPKNRENILLFSFCRGIIYRSIESVGIKCYSMHLAEVFCFRKYILTLRLTSKLVDLRVGYAKRIR